MEASCNVILMSAVQSENDQTRASQVNWSAGDEYYVLGALGATLTTL